MTSSNYVGEARLYVIPNADAARQQIPGFNMSPEDAPYLAVHASTGLLVFGRAAVVEILYAWTQAADALKAVQP